MKPIEALLGVFLVAMGAAQTGGCSGKSDDDGAVAKGGSATAGSGFSAGRGSAGRQSRGTGGTGGSGGSGGTGVVMMNRCPEIDDPIAHGLPCPDFIFGRYCEGEDGSCICKEDGNENRWDCTDMGMGAGGTSGGSGGSGQGGSTGGTQSGQAGEPTSGDGGTGGDGTGGTGEGGMSAAAGDTGMAGAAGG
jgi:hypothetical protein